MSMLKETLLGTTLSIGVGGLKIPMTITLKSSDAGRAIQIATDEGVEFFTPALEQSTATMLVVSISSPITNINFIGAIGDIAIVKGN